MITKVITDEVGERIEAKWDKERFVFDRAISLNSDTCKATLHHLLIANPREAQEIADFINQNNGEYQRELRGKKLQENIERLG